MKIFAIFLITTRQGRYGGVGDSTPHPAVRFFIFVHSDNYDAWGNVTVKDAGGAIDDSATFIGNVNPIRYRGYYYDTETGFYYLQTRYYDPTICRFINADNYELVAQLSIIPGQLNMYAYANNNPIMCIDPTGQSWKSFWKGVGDWFTDHWEEVVIGTVFIIGGAIVSALTCGTGTTAVAAFGTALLSSTIQVGTGIAVSVGINGLVNVVNGNNFFDNVGDTIANAYMWGGIFSGGSQMVSGGFRKLKAKGFSGISNAKVGLLSPDKLYYKQAGMTIFRLGNPHGIRVALDFGKYGIHVHLFGEMHIWAIPGIVGAIEYFN